MVFFRERFAVFLNNNFVKILVLLVFGLYLVGAGYGFTKIEEGLERRKVAQKGSYAIEFFDREDDFFREFPYRYIFLCNSNTELLSNGKCNKNVFNKEKQFYIVCFPKQNLLLTQNPCSYYSIEETNGYTT